MSTVDRLNAAAAEGDIGKLYELIKEDPYVLEHIEAIPFVETPLHVAASAGRAQFAVKIMSLKPSFGLKLNPQGFAPIHLALQCGHNRMVLHLVHINKDLIRVKGREDLTPLHFASQAGEVDLLTKFLEVCPDSINDVTVRNETALHIALKYQKREALEFLLKWLKTKTSINLEETIVNWKDEDGNTILHIAASNNDTKAIALLIKSPLIVLDAKNLKGQTALNITSNEDIKRRLVRAGKRIMNRWKIRPLILSMNEWLIRKTGMRGHMSEELLNAYLVVATLVATTTYQAALSPPGGLHQNDVGTNWKPITGNEAKSSMSNKDFIAVSITNTFCFMASTFAIVGLLPKRNTVACLQLYLSMILLQMSYMFSILVMSPTHLTTNVVFGIFVFLEVIFVMELPVMILIGG